MKDTKVLWFTGLSGAGKSTITKHIEAILTQNKKAVLLLDGDTIREKINTALGFSREDVRRNNRLIAELCQKNIGKYDFILVAVISPYRKDRADSRGLLGGRYHEVYVKASLDEVIKRDTKGLYQKALAGEIENFIGIDENAPYEVPEKPELMIDTQIHTIEEAASLTLRYLNLQESLTQP